jgi:hypoxanthine phosphoribosyltransferase
MRGMDGDRVLLVDDTWTTGSHLQSAASALSLADADVVAAVVVGRVIRTAWSFTGDDWWSEMRQTPFTFDSCCLE